MHQFDKEIAHDYLRMITVLPLWFGSVWEGGSCHWSIPPPPPTTMGYGFQCQKGSYWRRAFLRLFPLVERRLPSRVGAGGGGGVHGRIFCFRLFSLNRDTEILGMITVTTFKNPQEKARIKLVNLELKNDSLLQFYDVFIRMQYLTKVVITISVTYIHILVQLNLFAYLTAASTISI